MGVKVALVVGGDIFRGQVLKAFGLDRSVADYGECSPPCLTAASRMLKN